MNPAIYLDYAATTPVDPKVAEKLNEFLTMDGVFANPASRSHIYGWQAEAAVEQARKQVAGLINADTREIVWTSGATESDNLAIKGVAESRKGLGRHIISSQTEHKAVIDSLRYLEQKGFEVTWLKPQASGEVRLEDVQAAIRPDTILISLMHVNNETGVINDIKAIGDLALRNGVLFHVDAAQSAGKLELDTQKINVDLISMSAHKIYGPKGVGCLYVRRREDLRLTPIIHGGGHERGMRSGTLATHQIAAMGLAAQLAGELMEQERRRLAQFKSMFLDQLKGIGCVHINGDLDKSVAGILNIGFEGVDGQTLLSALPMLAVSSGSACNSASLAPSHVLRAMGLDDELALSSLRFSFGRFTTEEEVLKAAQIVANAVSRLTA